MLRDYSKMAVNNIVHRKTRSWLTLIGIFIGIAAVVALISLGQGLQQALTSEFLALGADKLEVYPKGVGFQSSADIQNDLRDRDIKVIQQTLGVKYALGFSQQTAKVVWSKDQIGFYPVLGFSDEPLQRKVIIDFFTLKLGEGRELKQGDKGKAVIGYELTNPDKLDRPMKLGDKLLVNGSTFEIVGIYQKMGDPQADNAVYVGQDGYNNIFGKRDKYAAVVVQAEPGIDINIVADSVKQELRRSRNLKVGDENFEVQTPQDLVNSFAAIFNIVQFVIIGIAGISLVVGGVGIMNTMYTSVLERTKEIGIMKAIGATNATVLIIFILESGLLGLVGGLIGVLSGFSLALITEYVGKHFLDTTLLSAWFSWWLVFGALSFAFIVGVGAGILPARQASKQKPVDSLRYE